MKPQDNKSSSISRQSIDKYIKIYESLQMIIKGW